MLRRGVAFAYEPGGAERCRAWNRTVFGRGDFPFMRQHRGVDFLNVAGLPDDQFDAIFNRFAQSYGTFGGFTWADALVWGWIVFIGLAAFSGVWLVILAASRVLFA